MKKLLIICLFILLSIIPFSGIKQVVADSENQFQVITKCNLYKEAKINYEEENGIVVQLFFGDVINVAGEPVKEENEDFYFYQASITKNGTEYNGYVIINFVTSVDNVGLERTLDPNAKTLNKANIYTAKDENEKFVLGDKEVVLDQYQGIKVLDGYDRSKNFHQIMFEVDGNIYTGYIKTSDLLVEGYNATTLVVVFIFILVAGIVLSIFFTTRKNRKKQKNNTIETL